MPHQDLLPVAPLDLLQPRVDLALPRKVEAVLGKVQRRGLEGRLEGSSDGREEDVPEEEREERGEDPCLRVEPGLLRFKCALGEIEIEYVRACVPFVPPCIISLQRSLLDVALFSVQPDPHRLAACAFLVPSE